MEYIYNSSKSRCDFTPAMKEFAEKTFKSTEKRLKKDEPIKLSMEICKDGTLLLKCRMVTEDNKHLLAEVATGTDYYEAMHELKNKINRLLSKNKKRKVWTNRLAVDMECKEAAENFGKQKMIVMESITPDKAIKELDALGHEWYVFKNREENDAVCVVYKRFEGNYGLVVCK